MDKLKEMLESDETYGVCKINGTRHIKPEILQAAQILASLPDLIEGMKREQDTDKTALWQHCIDSHNAGLIQIQKLIKEKMEQTQ